MSQSQQQQLRVSSLLVSRKSGVESSATHNAKDAAATAAAQQQLQQQQGKRKYAEQAAVVLEEDVIPAPSTRTTRSSSAASRAATPVRSSSRLSRSNSGVGGSDGTDRSSGSSVDASSSSPTVAEPSLAASASVAAAAPSSHAKRKASFGGAVSVDSLVAPSSKRSRLAESNREKESPTPTADVPAPDASARLTQPEESSVGRAAPVRAMSDVSMAELPALESVVPAASPVPTAPAVTTDAMLVPESVEPTPAPVAVAAAAPPAPAAGRFSRGAALLAMSLASAPAPAPARPAPRWTAYSAAASAAAAAIAAAAINARTAALTPAPTPTPQQPENEDMLSQQSLSLVQPLAPSFPSAPATTASSSSGAHRPLLVAPAFKSSADLQSRLSGLVKGVLPFPTALSELIQVFHAVDTALMLEKNRASGSYPAPWSKLQPSVQRLHPRRSVGINMVQQVLTLYPRAYEVEERHTVDKFGKLHKDYKISFGDTNQLGDEQSDADVKAALMTSPASSASASGVNLELRRRTIESRMLQYVYEQHQRFLQGLAQQMAHDSIVDPSGDSSASSSSSSASSGIVGGRSGAPTSASAVAAFLAAPLGRLRCWYPGFQLDSPLHVPPLALEPLPDTQLSSMLERAAHADSGMGLLGLANRRQPLPARMSLNAEQRGVQSSTSHGSAAVPVRGGGVVAVKEEHSLAASFAAASVSSASASTAAAAGAAAAAAAAANAAVSAASSTAQPQHKDLSVLSPALVTQFRAQLARNQAASTALHGDPLERERLRQLLKLRPLYESISFRLRGEGRPNMPLAELVRKLRSSGDWPEEAALRTALGLLAQLLPSWCSLGTSGSPPREIFRTQPSPRLCIDPATGQDKHVQRLERAVRECEEGLAAAAAAAAAPSVAPAPVSAPAAAAASTAVESVDVRVKIENADEMIEGSAAAAASGTAAGGVIVKQECVLPSAASLAASTSSLVSRVASSPAALRVPASPLIHRHSNVSGRAAMLAKAAARTQPPAGSPAPKAKPSATGSLAARLSNMR